MWKLDEFCKQGKEAGRETQRERWMNCVKTEETF